MAWTRGASLDGVPSGVLEATSNDGSLRSTLARRPKLAKMAFMLAQDANGLVKVCCWTELPSGEHRCASEARIEAFRCDQTSSMPNRAEVQQAVRSG